MPPFPDGVQLRLFLDDQTLPQWLLPYIIDRGAQYGRKYAVRSDLTPQNNEPLKRLVIEFSSPNIASEFHGKHLRSTLFGAQLANLYEAAGWDVVRLNYLGDWGRPIGLLGAGFQRYGSQEALLADPVTHLHDVYQKTFAEFLPEQQRTRQVREEQGDDAARETESQGLHGEGKAFLKRMEEGDRAALEFAEHFRENSIKDYSASYARLGVTFNEYSGESKMVDSEAIDEVVKSLEVTGLVEDGASGLTINLKDHGARLGAPIIRNRDGSSTYLLRDLVAVLDRHRKHSFDKMLYVVAADSNKMHFLQLFKIVELLGHKDVAEKLHHVSFNDNSRIPKAGDQEQTLAEFLDRCETATKSLLDAGNPSLPALGPVAVPDLCKAAMYGHAASVKPTASLNFDPKNLLSPTHGSGLDDISWYQSLVSVEHPEIDMANLSVDETPAPVAEPASEDMDLTKQKRERQRILETQATLLRLLARYPEIVESALHASDPSLLMVYVSSLVASLATWFPRREGMRTSDQREKDLLATTRMVMGNALKLLGISVRSVHGAAHIKLKRVDMLRTASRDSGICLE